MPLKSDISARVSRNLIRISQVTAMGKMLLTISLAARAVGNLLLNVLRRAYVREF